MKYIKIQLIKCLGTVRVRQPPDEPQRHAGRRRSDVEARSDAVFAPSPPQLLHHRRRKPHLVNHFHREVVRHGQKDMVMHMFRFIFQSISLYLYASQGSPYAMHYILIHNKVVEWGRGQLNKCSLSHSFFCC